MPYIEPMGTETLPDPNRPPQVWQVITSHPRDEPWAMVKSIWNNRSRSGSSGDAQVDGWDDRDIDGWYRKFDQLIGLRDK